MCISVCVCVIERGRPVRCILFWGLGGSQMERMKVHETENYIFPLFCIFVFTISEAL